MCLCGRICDKEREIYLEVCLLTKETDEKKDKKDNKIFFSSRSR